jgi:hypothetical protein
MRDGDWHCPTCKELIFAYKSFCIKCKVDKHGVYQNQARKFGDWNCPRCNDKQFARNTLCRKCGCPKNNIIQDKNKSFVKSGDWNCPRCNDLQFARNKVCRMCNTPNPHKQQVKLIEQKISSQKTENENINDVLDDDDDDNLCSICLTNNKNTLLLHSDGKEGHLCCCGDCGKMLMQGNKICPMCRKPITNAIRAF